MDAIDSQETTGSSEGMICEPSTALFTGSILCMLPLHAILPYQLLSCRLPIICLFHSLPPRERSVPACQTCAASPGLPSAASLQILSSLIVAFAPSDTTANCVSDHVLNLFMAPTIAPLTQGLRPATEDVLQCS